MGACHLAHPTIGQVMYDALLHFNGARYRMLSFAVMPNHVHVAVTDLGEEKLPKLLHSWKSFVAHEATKIVTPQTPFWQRGSSTISSETQTIWIARWLTS